MKELNDEKETEKKRRTARRGNGEGSIHQRSDKLWAGTISLGFGGDGKRKRRTVYGKTKKEVAAKLMKLQSEKLDGGLLDAPRMTAAAWLDRWLDAFAAQSVRASTLASYRQIVRLHISPEIGGIQVGKLHAVQIQGLYAKMQQAGKSPRLIQMVHAVLHRAMGRAVKLGLVRVNPCHAVERPRVPKHEITAVDPDQIAKLLRAAEGDRLEALYILAISSGMRQGELLGLKWEDIDFENGILSVRRTILELKGKFIIGEPKTKSGTRQISLPAKAVEALEEHRRRMLAEGNAACEWVFCTWNGKPFRRASLTYNFFRPLIERAGIPRMRFHDLRHASATLMLSSGVHPKVVQERLGHSQISVTMDTCSHVLAGMDAKAAGTFDSILAKRDRA